jgi:hypothetical protein
VRPTTGKAVETLLVAALQLVNDAELLGLVAEAVEDENDLTKELKDVRSRLQLGLQRVRAYLEEQ